MDDRALLEHYLAQRSQEAFTVLVNRHLALVYSTALRITGQSAMAEDVAQNVFIRFARFAPTLRDGNALPGWLYRAACHLSYNALRAEKRRRANETAAMQLSEMFQDSRAAWERLAPLLDEGMAQLDEADQNIIVQRFFEGRSLREVGANLGLSDDTAQKRVHRALEKLREYFSKNGVAVPALVLIPTLSENAIGPVPAPLAAKVSTAVHAAVATGGSLVFLRFLFLMSQTKIKTGLVVMALIALATTVALHLWTDGKSIDDRSAPASPVMAAAKLAPKIAGLAIEPPVQVASANATSTPAAKPLPASPSGAESAVTQNDAAGVVTAHEQVMRALITAWVSDMGKGTVEAPFYPKDWFNTTGANLNPDQLVKVETIRSVGDGLGLSLIENPEHVVFITESAFQLPDGKWCRIYGFADGHIETATSPINDFTAWEAEHTEKIRP